MILVEYQTDNFRDLGMDRKYTRGSWRNWW